MPLGSARKTVIDLPGTLVVVGPAELASLHAPLEVALALELAALEDEPYDCRRDGGKHGEYEHSSSSDIEAVRDSVEIEGDGHRPVELQIVP